MRSLSYGWDIVAASLVVMTFGIGGGLYLFGVLVPSLLSEFAWTHAQVSVANSIAMIVMGIASPLVARAIDRLDIRAVIIAGAAACGVGFGGQACVGRLAPLNGIASPLTQLYLCYVLYGAGLAGVGYVPVNTIVARWFATERGLALGIVSIGVGLGGFLTIPAGWLVDHLGWRGASATIGAAIAAVIVPLAAFVIRPIRMDGSTADCPRTPSESAPWAEPGPSPLRALRSPTFWSLAIAFGVYTVTVTIVRVFGIALLQEKGLAAADARIVVSELAFWGIVGKAAFGGLSDRVASRLVATGAFVLAAAGTLMLFGRATTPAIAAFTIVYGLPMGGIATLQPVLVAEHFGRASFASVYSALVLLLTLGAAAGPLVAGRVYDLGGGYQPTLLLCAIASGAAALLMMTPKRAAAAPLVNPVEF